MIGRVIDVSYSVDGKSRVSLCLRGNCADELAQLMNADVDVSIKKHRNRRSLDANAYAWALISQIAERITPPLNKEETYLEMLRRYGQSGVISVRSDAAEAVRRAYKYADELATAELNGREFVHLRVYIGSSEYDTREMALFLDGIIEEARALGIDTDTPARLALYEEGRNAKQDSYNGTAHGDAGTENND